MFFSVQLSGILSPKKTTVSYLCCFCHVVAPAVSGAVMFCIGAYGEVDVTRLFCIANLLRKIVTKQ